MQNQKIIITGDDAGGIGGNGQLEELVVFGVAAIGDCFRYFPEYDSFSKFLQNE